MSDSNERKFMLVSEDREREIRQRAAVRRWWREQAEKESNPFLAADLRAQGEVTDE